jgi:TonB family protein
MKRLFFLFICIYPTLVCFPQDTILLFLDDNYLQIKESKATITRTAIMRDDHFFITDRFVNGRMINYGEYASINPWIEDGTCIYYDHDGSLYSSGTYNQGKLVGDWVYYLGDKKDTINYQTAHNYYTYLKDTCILDTHEIHPNDTLLELIKRDIIDFIDPQLKLPARTREIGRYYLINAEVIVDIDGGIKCPKIEDANLDLVYESLRVLALYKCNLSLTEPMKIVVPIVFNTKTKYVDDKGMIVGSSNDGQENDGVWFVDENATFLGGDLNTFSSWIGTNIRYPYEAAKRGIWGKVFVQFSVDTNGYICDIKVVRSQHPLLDNEAIRVLKTSPIWSPAKYKGEPVKQNFVIPIAFNLN